MEDTLDRPLCRMSRKRIDAIMTGANKAVEDMTLDNIRLGYRAEERKPIRVFIKVDKVDILTDDDYDVFRIEYEAVRKVMLELQESFNNCVMDNSAQTRMNERRVALW